MADAVFEHPRLAAIYDALDPDRSDLDMYVSIAEELGPRAVLDVGCGTGTFALLLADRGLAVTGVDPAGGSLGAARSKPGADGIGWIHGDATGLPPMQVDLATMTGNVGQAIVDPSDWEEMMTSDSTLRFRERDEVAATLLAQRVRRGRRPCRARPARARARVHRTATGGGPAKRLAGGSSIAGAGCLAFDSPKQEPASARQHRAQTSTSRADGSGGSDESWLLPRSTGHE